MAVAVFQTGANPKQREAIKTTDGPLLMIPDAGSGKTSTLVGCAEHPIAEKQAASAGPFAPPPPKVTP